MNDETLAALRESIAHWERLRDGVKGENIAPDQCALCQVFMLGNDDCVGCPVYEKTGLPLCDGTPYRYAAFLYHEEHCVKRTGTLSNEWRSAAQAEVDFLKSLLCSEMS